MPTLLHVALPIAIATAMPFLFVMAAKAGRFSRKDNHETRNWVTRLTGWRQRAYWSHQNALETFPMFAAAVIVAHLGAPGSTYAMMAAYAYCALRLLYFGAFVADLAVTRSIVWFASMGAVGALFFIAISP